MVFRMSPRPNNVRADRSDSVRPQLTHDIFVLYAHYIIIIIAIIETPIFDPTFSKPAVFSYPRDERITDVYDFFNDIIRLFNIRDVTRVCVLRLYISILSIMHFYVYVFYPTVSLLSVPMTWTQTRRGFIVIVGKCSIYQRVHQLYKNL